MTPISKFSTQVNQIITPATRIGDEFDDPRAHREFMNDARHEMNELKPTRITFSDVCNLLNKLQTEKGKSYGLADDGEKESWNQNGEVGAYFTMKRKIDRLHKYIMDAIQVGRIDDNMNIIGKEGEPIVETMADLAVYSVKYVQWIANELDNSQWSDFVIRNNLKE
jgi:hypothetical protein